MKMLLELTDAVTVNFVFQQRVIYKQNGAQVNIVDFKFNVYDNKIFIMSPQEFQYLRYLESRCRNNTRL